MPDSKFEPLVSIIIPVYNGENYLQEAINSALKQTYKNLEILIINDGSTDRTEEIALSYGDRIRYFRKENGGVATALNLGIDMMAGDYFSWLSHDDLYNKNKIKCQVKALSKIENKDTVVGCYHLVVDKDRYILKRLKTVNNKYDYEKQNALVYLFKGYVQGCDLLISKKIFKEYGNFDINLITTQDYDLWFRIFRTEKLLIVPEYLVYYRSHGEQYSSAKNKRYVAECNELWIGFDSRLTSREKISAFGSESSFYEEVYNNLRDTALYPEAIAYYKVKLNKMNSGTKEVKEVKPVPEIDKKDHLIIKYFSVVKALYAEQGLLVTIGQIYGKACFVIINILIKKV